MKLICGPMATISHPAFRIMIEKFGCCDEYFTEMINAGTLLTNGPFEKYYIDPTPVPQKVVWQLTGRTTEHMEAAAKELVKLPGIGIDINMGCSAPDIYRFGSGIGWMLKTIEETKEYANLFLEQIMVAANNESYNGKTYADCISSIIKEYNLASLTTDIQLGGVSYAKLKSLGIEVSVSATTAYSSSTETDEELEEIFKNFWNDVKDGKVEGSKFTSTTKALDFTNELISDTFEKDNTLSKAVVIKVTDYTYTVNSTKKQVVLPSEEVVERYLIVNKPDDEKTDEELSVSVTTREKAAVEAYYKTALKVFTTDDAIGDALIEVREADMASGKISFANAGDKAKYDALMEASK